MHRTVGISPGEGLGEGTPSPAKRTAQSLHRVPAPERGSRGKSPGRAQPGGGDPENTLRRHLVMHRSPLSPTPPAPPALLPRPHRKGAVVAISPERPARDAGPDSALRAHHPIRRTVGDIARGGARGGNSLPGEENHTVPPQGSRAGAGVLVARALVGRNRERRSIHRFPLSPTPPKKTRLAPPQNPRPGSEVLVTRAQRGATAKGDLYTLPPTTPSRSFHHSPSRSTP